MSDVEPQDTALELMSLYKALRATPDPRTRQAIKQRIDVLIEEAQAQFQPLMVGSAQARREVDA